eukprot:NODE_115_length_19014_cov_0.489664.p8 type:complete len:158 gc:universal NODE_115_length_19014_cov_0.489664:5426-4953(-)
MMISAFLVLVAADDVTKTIGLSGSCSLKVTYTSQGDMVSDTVTNATKLATLFTNKFIYSNATLTKTGTCNGFHLYDHALGEKAVAIDSLTVKNITDCTMKEKQRHYMFQIWNATQIEQELNLFYVCATNAPDNTNTGSGYSSVFSSLVGLLFILALQ